jgi:Ni,Fe-hydrogenase maturation factor
LRTFASLGTLVAGVSVVVDAILAVLKELGVVVSAAVKRLAQELAAMVSNYSIALSYAVVFAITQALSTAF